MVCAGRVERQRLRLSQMTALTELPLVFEDWIDLGWAAELTFRERLFTPSHTFWLFLSQAFSADGSCDEAVRKALAHVAFAGRGSQLPSASTSAYCQARKRLPGKVTAQILERLTEKIERQPEQLWYGHPVKVVDGSTCSMPDTTANQEFFGQPSGQKPGCGFPVMRLAAMFSLSSGALIGRAYGPFSTGERTLWRELWDKLEPGDILLADRGFCGYADFGLLLGLGVDSVMRLHGRRSTGVREIQKLGKGDYLVEWIKSKPHPDWISREDWQQMPETLIVRHITFKVPVPGLRTQEVTVATTLLESEKYPAEAFAELYRRRWQAELYLRDLKTSMGMDVLRCKTPEMIFKELDMHLIAYNLIRALMLTAAARKCGQPADLSFKQSLNTIRQWTPALVEAKTKGWHREMLELLYHYLAESLLHKRPDRTEPRAVKRRPKNYQRLTNRERNSKNACTEANTKNH